jgi:hypothetical protein
VCLSGQRDAIGEQGECREILVVHDLECGEFEALLPQPLMVFPSRCASHHSAHPSG